MSELYEVAKVIAEHGGPAVMMPVEKALYELRCGCSDLLHLVSGAIHSQGHQRDELIRMALKRCETMDATITTLAVHTEEEG